ncbi:MAG: hypothetical protein WC350_04785 [Candidatus Micrarchaeia archaeon]|jgi:hypothetical protein
MPVKKFISDRAAFISRQMDVVGSKITISPRNIGCSVGGKVSAIIILELKKPVRARSLSARLYCVEQKKVESTREMARDDYRMDRELGVQRSTHLRTTTSVMETVAYAETKEVSGEKEYKSGRYEVEFSIPSSAPGSQPWSGGRKVTWRMEAKLDIPMSMDVSSSAEIEVC